jgi:type 1 glutamine amidotransferase
MKKILAKGIRYMTLLTTIILYNSTIVAQEEAVPILILSGQNNHEWQKTTPVLQKLFENTGFYNVSITDKPDTLTYSDYRKFRLVVSNWNSWPDTSKRLDKKKEQDFTRYMSEGGGALFIHAGGSSFYGWTDYHSIAMGRWGKNTSHGPIGEALVTISDPYHPITRGLKDYVMTDEIWENTEIHPNAVPLGWAQKKGRDGNFEAAGHPAILVSEFGKGRSFYTILGHDEKVLSNPDLGHLLIRAAAWVSRVESSVSGGFGTFQFHRDRKPHFHPLISPKGTVLTSESPRDHLWHMGLWFSWKFIDGLNYWEYTGDANRHVSEGMTRIESVQVDSVPSGAKEFRLNIIYHPWDKKDQPVMKESQKISLSAPGKDRSYHIDYDVTFTALKDLLLDRTPIPGEPGGQSWGGYSGMSIRLNTEFRDIRYFSASGEPVNYGNRNRWVACEFVNGKGTREQVIIFDHPGNKRYPSPWYCINDPATPMYYFSPAILYKEPMSLKKGEVLHLMYRIHLPGNLLIAKEIDEIQFR